jgi:hypothetical protein
LVKAAHHQNDVFSLCFWKEKEDFNYSASALWLSLSPPIRWTWLSFYVSKTEEESINIAEWNSPRENMRMMMFCSFSWSEISFNWGEIERKVKSTLRFGFCGEMRWGRHKKWIGRTAGELEERENPLENVVGVKVVGLNFIIITASCCTNTFLTSLLHSLIYT